MRGRAPRLGTVLVVAACSFLGIGLATSLAGTILPEPPLWLATTGWWADLAAACTALVGRMAAPGRPARGPALRTVDGPGTARWARPPGTDLSLSRRSTILDP